MRTIQEIIDELKRQINVVQHYDAPVSLTWKEAEALVKDYEETNEVLKQLGGL